VQSSPEKAEPLERLKILAEKGQENTIKIDADRKTSPISQSLDLGRTSRRCMLSHHRHLS
jgi:hypothetical protein